MMPRIGRTALISRRGLTAAIATLAATAGVVVGVAPGAAAPTTGSAALLPPNTVLSPPSLLNAPYVDILAATVDYRPALGRVSATVFLRGAPAPAALGGPAYSITLRGPFIGRGASIGAGVVGVPARGSLAVDRIGSGQDTVVPARISYNGASVVVTATDDRLANLPLTAFDVTATSAGNGTVTSPLGVDRVSGRLGG
ncbi:hypothetical protein OG579_20240 [Williamsia herbipolensis]|uniref:Tat pathway signal sequence domain protein n=1 Tax=Williamsia herbipolensis TaxID=1603258 RepID=A0AAU4K1Q0_9NOCA|nr:hypothetical protein [Williamsia herbipolensis]